MPMDRENQILALIRHNPFITQNEIAESVGISRSAVAGHIASLTRKGVIRGRAYVTAQENAVLCIGGANLDSKATSLKAIRPASSNPVQVEYACGGVARNIAENLANLACDVSLLTVIGDDQAGEWVQRETAASGVNTGLTYVLPGDKTGSYTALLDHTGEMYVAFADMSIYDKFSIRMIQERWSHIAASRLVIADTNIPADCLEELIRRCKDADLPLFIDPVSSNKAAKLPADLTGVTAIFPNAEEAFELSGLTPTDTPDYPALAAAIQRRGVSHVLITLGQHGIFYAGAGQSWLLSPIPTDIVDVTGAGDAFVAGVAYGILHDVSYSDACRYGLAAAHLTLRTNRSVSSALNEDTLHHTIKERFE
ncbi:carbohydrate kinase [Cohnella yongneupensis]|uniref:Carbohydrate kinase n=1 Tax=Cohnella yongneupensis TaxID=425006 RepID=A0ABW0QWU4_9BACL